MGAWNLSCWPRSRKLTLVLMAMLLVGFSVHHIAYVEEYHRAVEKRGTAARSPLPPPTYIGSPNGRKWGYMRFGVEIPHPPPPPPGPWGGAHPHPSSLDRRHLDPMALRRNGAYVLHTLLPRIKREIDQDQGIRKGMAWDSCAVVGNSGNMKGMKMGEEIDNHAMVLRINNAPTAGFEEDVGGKTTVSFINGWKMAACGETPHCPCFPYGAKVSLVTLLFLPEHLESVKRCRQLHMQSRIFVVDSMMHQLAHRIALDYERKRFEGSPKAMEQIKKIRRNVPLAHSTGLQAVLMVLGLCKKVSIFGFGSNTTQHHFFEKETPKEYADHDYEAEMAFYMDLVTGGSGLGEWFPLPGVRVADPGNPSGWADPDNVDLSHYRRR